MWEVLPLQETRAWRAAPQLEGRQAKDLTDERLAYARAWMRRRTQGLRGWLAREDALRGHCGECAQEARGLEEPRLWPWNVAASSLRPRGRLWLAELEGLQRCRFWSKGGPSRGDAPVQDVRLC